MFLNKHTTTALASYEGSTLVLLVPTDNAEGIVQENQRERQRLPWSSYQRISIHSHPYHGTDDLFLTSGYVNFPPEVVELLTSFKGEMKFLFAAPQANSFFHDPGFASVIPALYNIVGLRMNYHK